MAEVARYIPIYCDPRTGLPKSWAHYILGLRYVRMFQARERVARMHEIAVGMARPEDREKWERELKGAQGWPLNA